MREYALLDTSLDAKIGTNIELLSLAQTAHVGIVLVIAQFGGIYEVLAIGGWPLLHVWDRPRHPDDLWLVT